MLAILTSIGLKKKSFWKSVSIPGKWNCPELCSRLAASRIKDDSPCIARHCHETAAKFGQAAPRISFGIPLRGGNRLAAFYLGRSCINRISTDMLSFKKNGSQKLTTGCKEQKPADYFNQLKWERERNEHCTVREETADQSRITPASHQEAWPRQQGC